MRDELKDRAISLLKDTYRQGYEDGLKDRHDRYEEICQGLWREVEEWESRIEDIKAEIAEYKDDKIIHAEVNEMIDIVLEIIDKYRAESEEV